MEKDHILNEKMSIGVPWLTVDVTSQDSKPFYFVQWILLPPYTWATAPYCCGKHLDGSDCLESDNV